MRIKFLGTGSAEGIPAINCDCDHCKRARKEGERLVRGRNAILFSLPGYELLVDTPPDIRWLLSRYDVRRIDGIFLTHRHHDHTGGMEEFLYWRANLDLFAETSVYNAVRREAWGDKLPDTAFHCAFHPGLPVWFDGFLFTPFAVSHTVSCFGLAIYQGGRKIVYTSDTSNRFSNYARNLMQGTDLLIVNTPRFSPPHTGHITCMEAIELREQVGAERLIMTHFNHHNLPADELAEWARGLDGVRVAYDGLEIEV